MDRGVLVGESAAGRQPTPARTPPTTSPLSIARREKRFWMGVIVSRFFTVAIIPRSPIEAQVIVRIY